MAPYRGVSRPVITFALERLMDRPQRRIRHRAGRDPPAQSDRQIPLYLGDRPRLRRRELSCRPWRWRSGASTCRRSARASSRRARSGRYLGIGFAAFSERTGYGTPAFAARGMESRPAGRRVELGDGPVRLRRGADRRQPARPGAAHHARADHRRRARHRARTHQASSTATPTARPMAGVPSPAVRWSSPAAPRCWPRARCARSSCKIASQLLEAAADDIVLDDGVARVAGTDRALPIETLARAAYHQVPSLQGRDRAGRSPRARPMIRPAPSRTPAMPRSSRSTRRPAACTIERFVVAEDAGRLINPMIVDGQIIGGVAQGIGNALLEEIIYDETGNILTATLADYLPPTRARDAADRDLPPGNAHRATRSRRPRGWAKAAPSARRRR